MKKLFILLIVILSLFTITACPSPEGSDPEPPTPVVNPVNPVNPINPIEPSIERVIEDILQVYYYCDLDDSDCYKFENYMNKLETLINTNNSDILSINRVYEEEEGVLYVGYGGGANWCTLGLDVREPEMAITDIDYDFIAIHEMLHHIGLYHELQRKDRDNWMMVLWNNIISGKEHNFEIVDDEKLKWSRYTYPSLDFNSIMMYHSWAFSYNTNSVRTWLRVRNGYVDYSFYLYSIENMSTVDTHKAGDVINIMINKYSNSLKSRSIGGKVNKWLPDDEVIIMDI